MAKGKSRTPEQKAKQKARTEANKLKVKKPQQINRKSTRAERRQHLQKIQLLESELVNELKS